MATATNDDDDSSKMPVWLDDTHIDPTWIREHTELACKSCTVEDISNDTRKGERVREGATLKLNIELEGDETKTLIIKQVPPKGRPLAQQLGLAREALFYNQLAPQIIEKHGAIIPKIYHAHGDMVSGIKMVLMEDLSASAIDSGILFGPGNPNNWNRDLPTLAARCGDVIPTASQVAKATFVELAQVHATFWCRHDILDSDKYNWMRGHSWLQGQGKESWEASQGLLTKFWSSYLEREKDGSDQVLETWDPTVRSAVVKAMEGISWEAQLQRLHKDGRWCVVHGDCWPGNFMWMINNNDDTGAPVKLKLLDWEMVGVGSGPQELGQYVLSNMDTTERRACEKELVEAYYEELNRCGVTNVDWEYCWSEYKLGGLERWLWFLVYFCGQEGFLLKWAQFFHNQIAAFMKDHSMTADDIVQPRP